MRKEIVGLFGLEDSGGSLLDKHGLLGVALVMLGGILFFTGRGDRDKEKEKELEVADAWDTENSDLFK